jgi:CRISPR-associated Csx2 family protein
MICRAIPIAFIRQKVEKNMSRIYLSFLGTSDYLSCNYEMSGKEKINNVRFVQEATILYECSQWDENDQIIIFTTEQAYQKNWLDNGQQAFELDQPVEKTGLYQRLKNLELKPVIKQVSIPSGKSESEIWEIFDIFYQQLEQCIEVTIDITHAFRSIPMLALVIINYTKILKNIKVNSILYGAMEAIGTPYEVKQRAIAERNIPVFNLTAFDSLLDWTVAIDRYITTGNADRLAALADQAMLPVFINKDKNSNTEIQMAAKIKRMVARLKDLTDSLSTCRATEIGTQAGKLKANFISIDQTSLIKPLAPLLQQLNTIATRFDHDNTVITGIESAKWCSEHNLVQQAYTILQETCITAFVQFSLGDVLD